MNQLEVTEYLLHNYSKEQLCQVKNCISDIRGILVSCNLTESNGDPALDEYLKAIYVGYRDEGVDKGMMTEQEFDDIYNVMTDIDDLSLFK